MANKTDTLHLRISPELKQKLRAAAAAEKRSLTNYIELSLESAAYRTMKQHGWRITEEAFFELIDHGEYWCDLVDPDDGMWSTDLLYPYREEPLNDKDLAAIADDIIDNTSPDRIESRSDVIRQLRIIADRV